MFNFFLRYVSGIDNKSGVETRHKFGFRRIKWESTASSAKGIKKILGVLENK